jgi:hypothetical protein
MAAYLPIHLPEFTTPQANCYALGELGDSCITFGFDFMSSF